MYGEPSKNQHIMNDLQAQLANRYTMGGRPGIAVQIIYVHVFSQFRSLYVDIYKA